MAQFLRRNKFLPEFLDSIAVAARLLSLQYSLWSPLLAAETPPEDFAERNNKIIRVPTIFFRVWEMFNFTFYQILYLGGHYFFLNSMYL